MTDMSKPAHHALVLNLHQPWGNIDLLRNHPKTAWQATEILYAYDRIPAAVKDYADIARVHLAMSGTLLEALSNPKFQARYYGIVKCGDLLWNLRNPAIDFLATGYYHPVFPLIPKENRQEHISRWLSLAGHLFSRDFQGFWPPELGFSMDMIPLLKKFGFRYVIVDSEQVVPKSPMRWEEIRYRPHIARYDDEEIIVIVRDRELSIAQENGMEAEWFAAEVRERTRWCAFAPLVCTVTDGDNGGWFRNTRWASNFWGAFYQPFCHMARTEAAPVSPIFIHDYLDRYGAHGEVIVRTGAWNTGEHDGIGFVQWTGSGVQKDARSRVSALSKQIHDAKWQAGLEASIDKQRILEEAMWRLLRAETSCNFFWGDAWIARCHADLDEAELWFRQSQG